MAKRPFEDLRIGLLGEEHDWGSFTCGVESLDRYLKTQAGQDVRRKANAVFILSEIGEPTSILGSGLGGDASVRIIQIKTSLTF